MHSVDAFLAPAVRPSVGCYKHVTLELFEISEGGRAVDLLRRPRTSTAALDPFQVGQQRHVVSPHFNLLFSCVCPVFELWAESRLRNRHAGRCSAAVGTAATWGGAVAVCRARRPSPPCNHSCCGTCCNGLQRPAFSSFDYVEFC